MAARKDERVFSTMDAKREFKLETRDLEKVTGLRRLSGTWGCGPTTLYYESDLNRLALEKYDESQPLIRNRELRLLVEETTPTRRLPPSACSTSARCAS